MKKAIYTSLGMHILIFILITVTLPEIKTKEIDFIPVEIIAEEEIIEITKKQEEKMIKEEPEVTEIKEVRKVSNPPLPLQKPSISKKEENIVSEKTKFVPDIPLQKPDIKDTNIKKNKEIANQNIFDDMLKNLEEPEPKTVKKDFEKIVNELAALKPEEEQKLDKKPSSNTLAKLEKNIANQIRKHYIIPPGLDSVLISDVKVPITINIRRDGKITRIVINKKALKRAQNDPVYRSFLEAAERAVKKLAKFEKLPLDLYLHWDKISINFTPI